MAALDDIYDQLTPTGEAAPAVDEFGNLPGTPGFDPNSTARANAAAVPTGPPGAITVAPNSLADAAARSIAGGWNSAAWDQNPGNLRSQLKLDELTTTAAARKFELQRAQQNAPIQDQLMQAKLAHEDAATAAIGATKLRQIQKDTTAMQHVAGFEKYMQNAPPAGTAEFDSYVRGGIVMFPDILTTKYANEHVPNLAKEHDLAMKAQGLQAKAEGQDFKATYGFPKSAINDSTVQVGNLVPGSTTQLKPDNTGTHVAITTPAGKVAVMPVEKYQALGFKLSPETIAARAGAAGSANAAPTLNQTPVQVQTLADVEKLPSGSVFLTPQGVLKRKP